MSIQAFFNRPNEPIDLGPLWSDMRATKERLVLASAWFTDTDTAEAFIQSPARQKTAIFNAADTNRGDKKALAAIRAYEKGIVGAINAGHRQAAADGRDFDRGAFPDVDIYILGSGNWHEGVMHHKFILCDAVVWVGSFNFTFQARKNYESLLRIESQEVVRQFYEEVGRLDPRNYTSHDDRRPSTFECCECGKVLAWHLHGDNLGYGDDICQSCLKSQPG